MSDEKQRFERKQSTLTRLLSSINFLVSENTSTRDTRQSARLECRAEVNFVEETGAGGKGFLIDISRHGLQLETERKLSRGRTIALNAPQDDRLDRTAPFMAKVRWSRKGKAGTYLAGLQLPPGTEDDPHWLEALLHQLGYSDDGSQRRRFIRADSTICGQLTPDDEESETVTVEVLNLGLGGALLKATESLGQNLQFTLTIGPDGDLPELSLKGTVLRVIPKDNHTLHPSRFATADDRGTEILNEYILKLGGRSGE